MKDLEARKIADRIAGTFRRLEGSIQIVAEEQFSYEENIYLLEEFLEDIKDVQKEVLGLLAQQMYGQQEEKENEEKNQISK